MTEFTGTPGRDTLIGSDGSDSIAGLDGDDRLSGLAGDDSLDGGAGRDTLSGDGGDDVIIADLGDSVMGGADDDLIGFTHTGEVSSFLLFINGDSGEDTLVLDFKALDDPLWSTASGAGVGRVGTSISYYGIEHMVISGGAQDDWLVGQVGADTLMGGGGDDVLRGGGGADVLDGGRGLDRAAIDLSSIGTDQQINYLAAAAMELAGLRLLSIEGLDLVTGAGDDDVDVSGESTGSVVSTGKGSDTITGGADWSDSFDGGEGDDLIRFGPGDAARGGEGDDLLVYAKSEGSRALNGHLVVGDAGFDRLLVDMSDGTETIRLEGELQIGIGAEFNLSQIESYTIIAGSSDDYIRGSLDQNYISGGSGDDFVHSFANRDTLLGGAGTDRLYIDAYESSVAMEIVFRPGQSHTIGETTFSGFEQVTLSSGAGTDRINLARALGPATIATQGGDDTIRGTGYADRVQTGEDDDLVFFGRGDQVDGGSGDDDLRFRGSKVPEHMFVDGGEGDDRLVINMSESSTQISSYGLSPSYGGVGRISYFGIERLVILGGRFGDRLEGNVGADTLIGSGGSDSLMGMVGDDRLYGGDGRDTLVGGLGSDLMSGGLQADVFVWTSIAQSGLTRGQRDEIRDFEVGTDRIDLSAIDADPVSDDDQAFVFLGDAGFTGAGGEIRLVRSVERIIVSLDADGDSIADFELGLLGAPMLTIEDFRL